MKVLKFILSVKKKFLLFSGLVLFLFLIFLIKGRISSIQELRTIASQISSNLSSKSAAPTREEFPFPRAPVDSHKVKYIPGELVVRLREKESNLLKKSFGAGKTTLDSQTELLRTNLKLVKSINAIAPLKSINLVFPQKERVSDDNKTIDWLDDVYIFRFETKKIDTLYLKKILEDKFKENLVFVEPNYLYSAEAAFYPNDYYYNTDLSNPPVFSWGQSYPDLWGIKKVKAPEAWGLSNLNCNERIVVGIIDTGVDYSHSDIDSNIWKNQDEITGNGIDDDRNGFVDDYQGWDFTRCDGYDFFGNCLGKEEDNDPFDNNGHGSHVAGIVASEGNNYEGTIGVAWQCAAVMPVKVLARDGFGSLSDIARGIVYARNNGAKVINLSLGGSGFSRLLKETIHEISRQGVLVVAAAGNSDQNAVWFTPAKLPDVITVSATDHNDGRTAFSNFGEKIDVAAPGGDCQWDSSAKVCTDRIGANILSLKTSNFFCYFQGTCDDLFVGGNYLRLRGTSMAAPFISGAAALILAQNSSLTPTQVESTIILNADDLGEEGWDQYFGYGRVNVQRAIENPLATILPRAYMGSPNDFEIIRDSIIQVRGNVESDNFKDYRLEYAVVPTIDDGSAILNWSEVAVGTTAFPGENSLLAEWNSDNLKDGYYFLRLKVNSFFSHYRPHSDLTIFHLGRRIESGWPVPLSNGTQSSTILFDLDNNGRKEIIAAYGNQLGIFDSDGRFLNDRWPQNVDMYFDSSPALGDVDGDGENEIVLAAGKVIGEQIKPAVFGWKISGEKINDQWPIVLPTEEESCFFTSTVALSDLNHDGKKEILTAGCRKLYVVDERGTAYPGWPQEIDSNFYRTGITVADINNDQNKEILALAGNGKLYGWKSNGQTISYRNPAFNFPKLIDPDAGYEASTPAVGDLDKDGRKEIVISTYDQGNIRIFRGDTGEEFLPSVALGKFASSPVLADLDNDGRLEIVVTRHGGLGLTSNGFGEVFVVNSKGEVIWRKETDDWIGFYSPAITDVDGDGKLDILTGTINGTLYAFKGEDGEILEGWPIQLGREVVATPSVDDVDNDGFLEVSIGTGWDDMGGGIDMPQLYLISLKGRKEALRRSWPTFQKGYSRAGTEDEEVVFPTSTPTPTPSPFICDKPATPIRVEGPDFGETIKEEEFLVSGMDVSPQGQCYPYDIVFSIWQDTNDDGLFEKIRSSGWMNEAILAPNRDFSHQWEPLPPGFYQWRVNLKNTRGGTCQQPLIVPFTVL